MVASLKPLPSDPAAKEYESAQQAADNRVLQVLMRRLGLSQTFGGNMIFMLNRAGLSNPLAFNDLR